MEIGGNLVSSLASSIAGGMTGGAAGALGSTPIPPTRSDQKLKKDIEDFDAGAFLDKLVPSKYKYKNPSHGSGEQVGVMAQDIEKGAPQLVVDTPEGKVVDYSKAGGPLFASLASLHKRLKKVEDK